MGEPLTNENSGKRKADASLTKVLEQGHVVPNDEKPNGPLPGSKPKEGARFAEAEPTVTAIALPSKRQCTGAGKERGEPRKGAQGQQSPNVQGTAPQGGIGLSPATNADTGAADTLQTEAPPGGTESTDKGSVEKQVTNGNTTKRKADTSLPEELSRAQAGLNEKKSRNAPPHKKQCTGAGKEGGEPRKEAQKQQSPNVQGTAPQGGIGVSPATNADAGKGVEGSTIDLLELAADREERFSNPQNSAARTLAARPAATANKMQRTEPRSNTAPSSVSEQAPPGSGEPTATNADTLSTATPRTEAPPQSKFRHVSGQVTFPGEVVAPDTPIQVTFTLPNNETLKAYFLARAVSADGNPTLKGSTKDFPKVDLDSPKWIEASVTLPGTPSWHAQTHLAVSAKDFGTLSTQARKPTVRIHPAPPPAPQPVGFFAGPLPSLTMAAQAMAPRLQSFYQQLAVIGVVATGHLVVWASAKPQSPRQRPVPMQLSFVPQEWGVSANSREGQPEQQQPPQPLVVWPFTVM